MRALGRAGIGRPSCRDETREGTPPGRGHRPHRPRRVSHGHVLRSKRSRPPLRKSVRVPASGLRAGRTPDRQSMCTRRLRSTRTTCAHHAPRRVAMVFGQADTGTERLAYTGARPPAESLRSVQFSCQLLSRNQGRFMDGFYESMVVLVPQVRELPPRAGRSLCNRLAQSVLWGRADPGRTGGRRGDPAPDRRGHPAAGILRRLALVVRCGPPRHGAPDTQERVGLPAQFRLDSVLHMAQREPPAGRECHPAGNGSRPVAAGSRPAAAVSRYSAGRRLHSGPRRHREAPAARADTQWDPRRAALTSGAAKTHCP